MKFHHGIIVGSSCEYSNKCIKSDEVGGENVLVGEVYFTPLKT